MHVGRRWAQPLNRQISSGRIRAPKPPTPPHRSHMLSLCASAQQTIAAAAGSHMPTKEPPGSSPNNSGLAVATPNTTSFPRALQQTKPNSSKLNNGAYDAVRCDHTPQPNVVTCAWCAAVLSSSAPSQQMHTPPKHNQHMSHAQRVQYALYRYHDAARTS